MSAPERHSAEFVRVALRLRCPACGWESKELMADPWGLRTALASEYDRHFRDAHKPSPIKIERLIDGQADG